MLIYKNIRKYSVRIIELKVKSPSKKKVLRVVLKRSTEVDNRRSIIGRLFHNAGLAIQKARSPNVLVVDLG